MPAAVAVVTLGTATVGSLFMAWTIGAGSSGSTPFAPAVGANAISTLRAGFLVGILGLLGAITQGANVSETIGSGLIRGVSFSPAAAMVGLFTAGALVTVGIFTGYPIATAFTVTGSMTGAGIALGGTPNWGTYSVIVITWVLIPVVGGATAYATAKLLETDGISTQVVVASLGALAALVVINMDFSVFGPAGEGRSLAWVVSRYYISPTDVHTVNLLMTSLVSTVLFGAAVWRSHGRTDTRTERRFLVLLGCLVAFSAGGTQVGLAVGPLVPLLDTYAIPFVIVLTLGGLGLLAGSWTGATRMIKALSQDYSALGPRRSIASLVPAFVIAQSAVFFGVPVSFNEIIVSSIIGAGFAAETTPVDRTKMYYTAVAWVGSLLIAGVVGYLGVTGVAVFLS